MYTRKISQSKDVGWRLNVGRDDRTAEESSYIGSARVRMRSCLNWANI